MAEGGPDFYARLHRIGDYLRGVDSEILPTKFGKMQGEGVEYAKLEGIADNLETLKNADTDIQGLNSLVKNIASGSSKENFLNYAHEATVAATLQKGGRVVTKVGQNVKTKIGATEIDIELKSGDTIEVKHGDLTKADKDQLKTQLAYRRENSLSGNHYVQVEGEISDEMESFLNKENIRKLSAPTDNQASLSQGLATGLSVKETGNTHSATPSYV
ncbi:hypothetical protein [Halococcoides cellulosivorans]|uniref:hypothetical protein n=1 Tax=Halococcoides cellulosivorans TaxID=1679096 RepID=UPI00131EECAC|nr:hypothetical protein [Halococcoides cellulosivorans]